MFILIFTDTVQNLTASFNISIINQFSIFINSEKLIKLKFFHVKIAAVQDIFIIIPFLMVIF